VRPPARCITEHGEAGGLRYAARLRADYLPLLTALEAPFLPDEAAMRERCAAVVPSANRGLKSSEDQFAESLSDDVPVVAIIDFLTFSAQLSVLQPGEFGARLRAAAVTGCETSIELLCRYVLHAIAPASGLVVDGQVRGFRNFYDHHMRILTPAGVIVGFVAMGGERQRGTFCVELTGEGCAHVKAWVHTREVLEGWVAKLSRVDCAHDDREGRFTLGDVQGWYDEGKFTTRGRPPAIGYAGYSDGSGQTIYVGKNTGNQQLCVYEKGKQLGDPSSLWVRFEARFGSKYREIPYEILERPWEFIVGHYPALSWISEVSTRMQTSLAKAAACWVSSIRHAKRQYGAVVNAIFKVFPDPSEFGNAVVKILRRDRLPAWVDAHFLGSGVLRSVVLPGAVANPFGIDFSRDSIPRHVL